MEPPNKLLKTGLLSRFRYYFMIQNELVGIFDRPAGHDLVRTTGKRLGATLVARHLRHGHPDQEHRDKSWPYSGTGKMPVAHSERYCAVGSSTGLRSLV